MPQEYELTIAHPLKFKDSYIKLHALLDYFYEIHKDTPFPANKLAPFECVITANKFRIYDDNYCAN